MSKTSILFISIVLHIPYAQSLKQKRQPVKSLKQRLQNRFNASVSEIDALDEWQRAVLGVVMIANDKVYLEQQVSKIEQIIIDEADMELVEFSKEFL
jgi:uncharacterized protein